MTSDEFDDLVAKAYNRCSTVLTLKGKEYSKQDGDRLEQFKTLSPMLELPPAEILWNFAAKHIHSVSTMVKCPPSYDLKKWEEKLTDIHNYLFLLEGLINEEVKD